METECSAPTTSSSFADIDDVQFQELIRSWIVQALSRDNPEQYRQLLADLKNVNLDDHMSVSGLSLRIKALSQTVSYINEQQHERLLAHVLTMSFWNCNDELANALHSLIVNLAASNGAFVTKCLDMLVRNFLPPSCGMKTFLDCYTQSDLVSRKITSESLKEQKVVHASRKHDVMNRVMIAIERIVELVPSAAARLCPIVQQRMPYQIVDKEWLSLYMENMLLLDTRRISRSIGSRMLMAIVDRLIEIDVEIAWEDILKEEDSSKVLVFQLDMEESEPVDGSVPDSEVEQKHVQGSQTLKRLKKTLDEVADKMDSLMDLTLDYLRRAADEGRVDEIFSTLMISFKSTVLDTYKSKFTQFLLFYICSLSPATCGAKFAAFLSETFLNRSVPPSTRMSAVAYLASYLSRANFLPMSVIFSSVSRLVNWCVIYTSSRSDIGLVKDAGLYGVFYAACQAVMYILCFRLRDLLACSTHRPMLKSLRLQQLVDHKLDPLKMCLPSVVEEFLRQAMAVQLVSHKCMLEPSNDLEALSFKSYGGVNKLEMFFPFDPYMLRISDRFIQPIYINWSPAGNDTEDDDVAGFEAEEDYEEDDEPVVEDEAAVESPLYEMQDVMDEEEEDETFLTSMECMSITPPPRMMPANLARIPPIS